MKTVKKKILLMVKWIENHPMTYIITAVLIYLIYNISKFIKMIV